MSGLASPGKFDESLEGLRVILSVRPTIFNFLVPKLLKAPLNVSHLLIRAARAQQAMFTEEYTAITRVVGLPP